MTPELRSAIKSLDRQFAAARAMPKPVPDAERYRLGITDVKKGGYIRVAGEVQLVVEMSRYREKAHSWFELELFGLVSGKTLHLECERNDVVEVSLSALSFSLRVFGVTADEVEEMSDNDEGSIRHEGRVYLYEDDYRASFHRGDGPKGEPVYVYEFESDDQRYALTVEEWGGEDEGYEYEVSISENIDSESIEVLVVGDGAVI